MRPRQPSDSSFRSSVGALPTLPNDRSRRVLVARLTTTTFWNARRSSVAARLTQTLSITVVDLPPRLSAAVSVRAGAFLHLGIMPRYLTLLGGGTSRSWGSTPEGDGRRFVAGRLLPSPWTRNPMHRSISPVKRSRCGENQPRGGSAAPRYATYQSLTFVITKLTDCSAPAFRQGEEEVRSRPHNVSQAIRPARARAANAIAAR